MDMYEPHGEKLWKTFSFCFISYNCFVSFTRLMQLILHKIKTNAIIKEWVSVGKSFTFVFVHFTIRCLLGFIQGFLCD